MASLLEAFFFSFSADTSAVREGIDSGQQGANQLNRTLSATDATANRLSASFLDLAKSAGALLAGTLAFGAIKSMVIASAEATNALEDQAQQYRINSGELLAWQNAVTSAGGTVEGFNSTLKMLGERYRDPVKGLERLTEVADRFVGLSDLQAQKLAERLGIDPSMIELMRGGAQGIRDLVARQKELGSVTKEDAEAARKYKQQLQDTNTVLDDVRRKVATAVLPALTEFLKLMEKLTIWARDNKWFVLAFFGGVAAIIAAIYLPAIISATVATFALIAPYLLIGLAIAAVAAVFALAYDDVMNFLAGNKSVIGEMEKKYPIVGDIVRGLVDAFRFLWDGIKSYVQLIIDIFTKGPQEAFDNFGKSAGGILDSLSARFPQLAAVFELIGRVISAVASATGAAWEKFFSMLKVGFDWIIEISKVILGILDNVLGKVGGLLNKGAKFVLDLIGDDDDKKEGAPAAKEGEKVTPKGGKASPNQTSTDALVATGKQQVKTAASAPTNSQTSNSINNSKQTTATKNTTVNVPSVTINTQSTDPKEIAGVFSKSLSDQLRSAQGQFDDGIDA